MVLELPAYAGPGRQACRKVLLSLWLLLLLPPPVHVFRTMERGTDHETVEVSGNLEVHGCSVSVPRGFRGTRGSSVKTLMKVPRNTRQQIYDVGRPVLDPRSSTGTAPSASTREQASWLSATCNARHHLSPSPPPVRERSRMDAASSPRRAEQASSMPDLSCTC